MAGARRLLGGLAAVGVLTAAALLLPIPGPAELRAWASGAGAAGALVLLLAYALLTVAPIPRTVFNLAAGLLLGEALGIAVAVVATAISGCLAFLLARAAGGDLLSRLSRGRRLRAVAERLADGGALAVASLRLIPVLPFAPLSYCCGLSPLRLRPYLTGTVLGSLPGTVAVVVLGDALTGTTPPALVGCYLAFAALGALGLSRVLSSAQRPAPLPARAGE
ncbi:putative membrane protein YdjX (TVP38/TMEM64 family) [Saccharomonospora amisosensis]|uniref:TVP38/TMEM64 family membrane protein n=1 Tax=Saccharomonospora amisosensis TaxID=1128677 RepID=A0A7X5UR31_9PSEU|nr:VTT domain-containing protein [Saccharomonospora amisosensis]NIJ12663.1 putative membrane protein YdjX (TVP38/TMEM64 family) [Saccharomonospora amisosensis]